jgi:hypothetical protein
MAKRKQSRLKHSDVVKQCERHNWFFQIRSVSIDDYLTLLNNCIDDDVQPKHPFNYVAFSYTWFKQNDSRSSTEFVVNITGYIQLQTPLKMTSTMLEQRIGLSVQTYGPDDQYLGHVEKYLTPKIIRLIVFSNCQHYIEAGEARQRGRDVTSICSDEEMAVQPDIELPSQRNTFGINLDCDNLHQTRETTKNNSVVKNSDRFSSADSTFSYNKRQHYTVPLLASPSVTYSPRSKKNSFDIFPMVGSETNTAKNDDIANKTAAKLPWKQLMVPAATTLTNLADDNIESGETGTSAMFSMMQQFLKSQYVKDILNEAITTATLNTHNTATTIQPIIPANDKEIVDSIANVAETQKKTK